MNEEAAVRPTVVLMADTIRPWRIPATWSGAVMAYTDGLYQWPAEQEQRFDRRIGISVTGNPAAARNARAIDVERFDASVEDVPGFLDFRTAEGHDDGTVYCSRVTLPPLFRELRLRRPRFIIATLDGRAWTPVQLANDIDANFNVGEPFDPAWIWGIQDYPANPAMRIFWDTTTVYGEHDFWDPR